MLASVSWGSPSSPCGQCPEVSHFLDLTWVLAVPGGVPGPIAPSTVDFEFFYSGSLFGNEIEKELLSSQASQTSVAGEASARQRFLGNSGQCPGADAAESRVRALSDRSLGLLSTVGRKVGRQAPNQGRRF